MAFTRTILIVICKDCDKKIKLGVSNPAGLHVCLDDKERYAVLYRDKQPTESNSLD